MFIDRLTGEPVEGIAVTVNGEQLMSDDLGFVYVCAQADSLLFEAYMDLEQLDDLGYQPGYGSIFERFTVTGFCDRIGTYYLDPLSDSLAFQVSGSVQTKSGESLIAGDIDIYTRKGRLVGDGDADGNGSYTASIAKYPNNLGNLYFIVKEDGGDLYYTMKNVTGSGIYDLYYDGTDITISGDTGDGEQIQAMLELGMNTWIYLGSESISGTYSITVPHRESNSVRVFCRKDDEYNNTYWYYSPKWFTSSAIENFQFSDGSTVDPVNWNSNISWDGSSRTLSFDNTDNATMYAVDFWAGEYPLLKCMIEGTTLTVPMSVDLTGLDEIDIKPYWTDGLMRTNFTWDRVATGTVIEYGNLYTQHFLGG
jgi:hypothetical protein